MAEVTTENPVDIRKKVIKSMFIDEERDMKFLNKSVRPYLEAYFYDALNIAMLELEKKRPDNPLEYLGKLLIDMSTKQY